MNNKNKEKLTEVFSFIACVVVLLVIGVYTGVLEDFSISGIQKSYVKAVDNLPQMSKEQRANILSSDNSTSQSSSKYNNYRANTVPETVIRGAYTSNTWGSIFDSSKKSIFYVYDPKGKDSRLTTEFHDNVQNYLYSGDTLNYYDVYAYTLSAFNLNKAGDVSSSKICDSLEECNQQRMKASDYSNMAEFFKRCSRTMCIFNPSKNQYILLKSRNAGEAISALEKLKNW